MKLFKAVVEEKRRESIVVYASGINAHSAMEKSAKDIMAQSKTEPIIDITEFRPIHKMGDLPKGWETLIPYASRDDPNYDKWEDKTCAELLLGPHLGVLYERKSELETTLKEINQEIGAYELAMEKEKK